MTAAFWDWLIDRFLPSKLRFIAYKLPRIRVAGAGPQFRQGSGYSYILPTSLKWTPSEKPIGDQHSVVGETLKPFFQNVSQILIDLVPIRRICIQIVLHCGVGMDFSSPSANLRYCPSFTTTNQHSETISGTTGMQKALSSREMRLESG